MPAAFWTFCNVAPMVSDSRTSPAGREPLSTSSSDSYPMLWGARLAEPPAGSDANEVPRQIRDLPCSADTVIARSVKLDMYMVPVREFSGLLPLGAPYIGSRHVGVPSGVGSSLVVSQLSL